MASSIRAGRRVVCFPFPYQGHFNPMLRLAGALHAGGVAITVFHTDLRAPDPDDYPSDYRFVPVPVHVPTELMGSEDIARLVTELNVSCAAPFKERLAALLAEEEEEEEEPGGVRCVVTDVIWYSAQAVARELGVPALGLMSSSAASFRNFMVYPALIEKGYLPVQEDHTDGPVDVLPPFRVRDLQRIETSSLNDFASLLGHTVDGAWRSASLIINTIEAIETVELDKIHEDMSIPVFVIGPLNKFSPPVKSSLYQLQQDRRCLDWLDTQTPGSVIYVSFGSLAAMDPHEFVELAWGWADSKRPFIWVVRPSLIRGFESGDLPDGVREEIGAYRGRIIDWAPQDEVLAHPTVCAFLTHNGWNSTMEAISEGVPMISRPLLGDQYGNAMFVCEVRRVGVEVEVENQLERLRIRDAIEKLMSSKEGKEVRERMTSLKETAENGIKESGSSHTAFLNLADLIFSL
ncbi:LOW QUALITY PROTEIN: DIMBOA UDP-glucosyltransferase BX9-like [Setaria italica]|uniref:LOW QUALITY PROTEIN: DIMBOA UDP-glucosyltransferase BX9-like n=1 Tax=Setaria italica TaxID=4555 RepID=UPI0006470AEE|nr:LOW QUALITY PROTEIN: DIMBOA UDP-glucosyltransferase BX9-like [Setaria italica]